MDGDLQIGVESDLSSLHATLKDRDCLVSAAAYDPFAEQLEQVGVSALFDQQRADHGEAWATLERALGLGQHLYEVGACVACVRRRARIVSQDADSSYRQFLFGIVSPVDSRLSNVGL